MPAAGTIRLTPRVRKQWMIKSRLSASADRIDLKRGQAHHHPARPKMTRLLAISKAKTPVVLIAAPCEEYFAATHWAHEGG